ncbi:MAG: hypothetical protein ACXVEF_18070 [Polyangiales bacterium]
MKALTWSIVCAVTLAACSSNSDGARGSDPGADATPEGAVDSLASDTATDDTASKDADVDPAVSALASSWCERYAACAPGWFALQWKDQSECRARMVLGDPTGTPGAAVTKDQDVACATALKAVTGEAACADFLQGKAPKECVAAAGTLADDTACDLGAQCKGGACIHATPGCGTCKTPPATAGTTCTDVLGCGSGLACVGGKCAAIVDVGGTCDATTPCAWSSDCVAAKCVMRGHEGDACDPMLTTAGRCLTHLGLVCDQTKKQCVKVAAAAVGSPCDLVAGVRIGCADGAICVHSSPTDAKCVAAVEDGGDCDSSTFELCRAPAECVGGKCVVQDPALCK